MGLSQVKPCIMPCIIMMHGVMYMRMKPITIRKLPPEVQRAVKERARKDGLSVNRAVGVLLEEARGRTPEKGARHQDFDKYAGRWRKADADAFDASLRDERGVDPDDGRERRPNMGFES